MADNETKITSKVKDPKRVESGKRLTAISKMAKERKRLLREQAEREHGNSDNSDNSDGNSVLYIVGSVGLLGGLYFAYKRFSTSAKEEPPTVAVVKKEPEPTFAKLSKLQTLD